MRDIQVDEDGELRCAYCGGKHFTEKRTFRAKAAAGTAGVLTVGLAGAAAGLLAKKKLRCQLCGKYNKMGNAQPYRPDGQAPEPEPEKRLSPQDQAVQDRIARQQRQGYKPPKKTPPNPGSSRAGQFITVKKPMRPGG